MQQNVQLPVGVGLKQFPNKKVQMYERESINALLSFLPTEGSWV